MIDIESTVFSRIAEALRAEFEGIYVAGEPVDAPPKFPAVCFWEASNTALEKSQTAESRENHASVMYQCEVYSNLSGGRKQQAREITKFIDGLMEKLGFVRSFGQPVPNMADATIYRYTARYKGVVGKDYMIYTK